MKKLKGGKGKKADDESPQAGLPMQVNGIDREKFLDLLAEALWPRIEHRVTELVEDAIDQIYISR